MLRLFQRDDWKPVNLMLGIVGSGDEESLSNTCGCHLTIMEEKTFLKGLCAKMALYCTHGSCVGDDTVLFRSI